MRRSLGLAVVLALAGVATSQARQTPIPAHVRAAADRINAAQLARDLGFLSSDELRGRNTPSPGFDAAARYVADRLRRAGLKPAGDNGTFFQHYTLREATVDTDNSTIDIDGRRLRFGGDFVLRSFAGPLTGTFRMVYVGHGWVVPDKGIDPYAGVDVRGKILLVHGPRALPKGVELPQIGRITPGASSVFAEAEKRGAAGIIFLPQASALGNWEQMRRQNTRLRELEPRVPSAYAAQPVTSLLLSRAAADAVLARETNGASIMVRGEAREYAGSFELSRPIVLAITAATSIAHRPYNVVAILEGSDPVLKAEHITVFAHLDGAVGTRAVEGDDIYNSADDNASGSAGTLSIAEHMAAARPKRSIVFVWDSGEEQGLWGTRQFVANPPIPLARIVAHFNIDMIGATRAPGSADEGDSRVTGPNETYLIGPGVLSPRADALLERVNAAYLKMTFNRVFDRPESEFFYPRTDAGPFLERGILTIGFTTGIHRRYHGPADEARFLDPQKIEAIARTTFVSIWALADSAERPSIERPIPSTVPNHAAPRQARQPPPQPARAQQPPALQPPARADILRGEYGRYRANNDLLFYHLDVRVDPDRKRVSGKNTIRFRMLKDDTRIQLDLYPNMTIERIVLGAVPLKYQRELNAVFIDFPETLKAGREYSIEFHYSGTPMETGRFGGFLFGKDPAGNPWIVTANEGQGASLWWPNKDQWRDEPSNMDLSVAIPNDLVDVSNGRFVGKTDLGDGYTRWDWRVHYPINSYNVSLNIGKYAHFGDKHPSTGSGQADLTLDYYVLPPNLEKARRQFAQVKPMLEAWEKIFGEYPFKKDGYKLIEVPYSGMEHQSAVTYGNRFANGYLERDWTGVGVSLKFDFIIIHESAHEWFGNAVSAADVSDMWIQEGWATYLENLYVEHVFGYDDALKYVNGYKSKVRNREPIITQRGIHRSPSQDQYFKGALFLNTLRSVVNDDGRWWKLLRDFYQRFKYQNILTEDMVAFFNAQLGRDVTPIFDQYLRRSALPVLELAFNDAEGTLAYRWKADEARFAMPVRVGKPGAWQIITPTTSWQLMKAPMAKDDLDVATELYYVDVVKQ